MTLENTKDIMVSVCMITYNHEPFIAQAIEGVLIQETNFKVELVIGEDCSTDGTRQICETYAAQYPDRIRLLPSENNLGMMPNFIRTLKACDGKYIALCEGDDYWTDPMKLQKQVDLLEKFQDTVCCFHNAWVLNQSNGKFKNFRKSFKKKYYSGRDLLKRWLIPTASMVFRNVVPLEIPDYLKHGTHGDLALQLLLAEYGKFRPLDDLMSVYRLNPSGITNTFTGLAHNNRHIDQIDAMKRCLPGEYDDLLNRRKVGYLLSNCNNYLRSKDRQKAWEELSKAKEVGFVYFFFYTKELFSILYKSLFLV